MLIENPRQKRAVEKLIIRSLALGRGAALLAVRPCVCTVCGRPINDVTKAHNTPTRRKNQTDADVCRIDHVKTPPYSTFIYLPRSYFSTTMAGDQLR